MSVYKHIRTSDDPLTIADILYVKNNSLSIYGGSIAGNLAISSSLTVQGTDILSTLNLKLNTTTAASTYLPLSGGTISGNLTIGGSLFIGSTDVLATLNAKLDSSTALSTYAKLSGSSDLLISHDSSNAFSVKNSGGSTTIFNVDTILNKVTIHNDLYIGSTNILPTLNAKLDSSTALTTCVQKSGDSMTGPLFITSSNANALNVNGLFVVDTLSNIVQVQQGVPMYANAIVMTDDPYRAPTSGLSGASLNIYRPYDYTTHSYTSDDTIIQTGNSTSANLVLQSHGYGSVQINSSLVVQGSNITSQIGSLQSSKASLTGGNVLSGDQEITGNLLCDGNVTCTGNFTVNGSTTTVNSSTISIGDATFELANNNTTTDITDIGIYGKYFASSVVSYGGFVRDASDGVWRLFENLATPPSSSVSYDSNLSKLKLASLTISGLATAGLVHNNASGVISTSLLRTSDLDNGTNLQIPDSNLVTISTAGKISNSALPTTITSNLIGSVTGLASLNLPLTGGILSGALTATALTLTGDLPGIITLNPGSLGSGLGWTSSAANIALSNGANNFIGGSLVGDICIRPDTNGNVLIGSPSNYFFKVNTQSGYTEYKGGIFMHDALTNSSARPALAAGFNGYSIYALDNIGSDSGFLRIASGGDTNQSCKAFIDLSGYNAGYPDMNSNIVLGVGGEKMRVDSNGTIFKANVSMYNSSLTIYSPADTTTSIGGGDSMISFFTNTNQASHTSTLRWNIGMGNNESTGNLGADFYIWRYAADGSFLSDALSISRDTGYAQFAGILGSSGGKIQMKWDSSNGCQIFDQTNGINWLYQGSTVSGAVRSKNNIIDDGLTGTAKIVGDIFGASSVFVGSTDTNTGSSFLWLKYDLTNSQSVISSLHQGSAVTPLLLNPSGVLKSSNNTLDNGGLMQINVAAIGPQNCLNINNSDSGATTSEARLVFSQGNNWIEGICGKYNSNNPYIGFSASQTANTWNGICSMWFNGGFSIGTSNYSTQPPTNGLLVQGNANIGGSLTSSTLNYGTNLTGTGTNGVQADANFNLSFKTTIGASQTWGVYNNLGTASFYLDGNGKSVFRLGVDDTNAFSIYNAVASNRYLAVDTVNSQLTLSSPGSGIYSSFLVNCGNSWGSLWGNFNTTGYSDSLNMSFNFYPQNSAGTLAIYNAGHGTANVKTIWNGSIEFQTGATNTLPITRMTIDSSGIASFANNVVINGNELYITNPSWAEIQLNSVGGAYIGNYAATTTGNVINFVLKNSLGDNKIAMVLDSNQLATIPGVLFMNNQLGNKVISLWDNGTPTDQSSNNFYGFGISSSILRYQVADATSDHVFYACEVGGNANEILRIRGNGTLAINSPSFTTNSNFSNDMFYLRTCATQSYNPGKERWSMGMFNQETQSGNTGSDFALWAYGDAGSSAFINNAFTIKRSDLTTTFTGKIVANSSVQISNLTTPGLIKNDSTGLVSSSLLKTADLDNSTNLQIPDINLATITTAGKIANSALPSTITANLVGSASLNVLKAGDTMTGALTTTGLTVSGLSTTGIVHNNSSGVLSTSLLKTADLDNSTNLQIPNANTSASSSNVNNAIVTRSPTGGFSCGIIQATDLILSGSFSCTSTPITYDIYPPSSSALDNGWSSSGPVSLVFANQAYLRWHVTTPSSTTWIANQSGTYPAGLYRVDYEDEISTDRCQYGLTEDTNSIFIANPDQYYAGGNAVPCNRSYYFRLASSSYIKLKWTVVGKNPASSNYYLVLRNNVRITQVLG